MFCDAEDCVYPVETTQLQHQNEWLQRRILHWIARANNRKHAPFKGPVQECKEAPQAAKMHYGECECLHHAESMQLHQKNERLRNLLRWIQIALDPNADVLKETVQEHLGRMGAMISWSKSDYVRRHPKELVVFNANVCIEPNKKIWWGDLNVTESGPQLQGLSNMLRKNVYVLYEMDARFENEASPIMHRAASVFQPF